MRRRSGRACALFRSRTEEQQANGVVFRARDLLVHQRTQCINALRGHLSEYGYVFPQGITHAAILIAHVEDPQSPLYPTVRATILKCLIDTFTALEAQIKELDAEINRRSKADPVARRLMTIPGVGPIAATAITALVPAAEEFPSRARLRGLARADTAAEIDRRQAEARRHIEARRANHPPPADPRGQRGDPTGLSAWRAAGSWLAQMLPRKPKMLVTVALANKMARMVWALWSKAAFTELRPRRRKADRDREGVGRAEGEYGATVGETGSGKPGLSTVLRARFG